jgi:hypothetical protein
MADNKYTAKDAAKDTGASGKETARAWHDARQDAQNAGELSEREANKANQSSNEDSESK